MHFPSLSRRHILTLSAAALLAAAGAASADAPEAPDMAEPAAAPAGQWLAEDILGGGVIDNAQVTLEIARDGSVSGRGGCNRYTGKATIDGDRISFGPLASTRMACAEALMDLEAKFHDALSRAASFRLEPAEQRLLLIDGEGQVLVRFTAM